MELLSHPVPAAIVLIGLLVFFHEAGHFLVGRWCGIAVEAFSIGFGPPIVSITRGQTEYRISWIPLGGFVKFYGMLPSEKVPDQLDGVRFTEATLGKRVATVSAGPLANLILAFIVYTIIGMSGISHPQAIVGEVQPGSAAQQADLEFLDKIVSIDGKPIKTWMEMREVISKSPGKNLTLKVLREDKTVDVMLTPKPTEVINILDNKVTVGRAGIAAAASPSIITLSDGNSHGAKAGLQVGDKISGYRREGETQWQPLKYWLSLEKTLYALKLAGNHSVELEVFRWSKSGFSKQPVVIKLNLIDGNFSDARAYTQALGIVDSQLTVESVRQNAISAFRPGDRILAWDGNPVIDVYQLNEFQRKNRKANVRITLQRDFKRLELDMHLHGVEVQMPSGKQEIFIIPVHYLGQALSLDPWVEKYDNVFGAAYYGLKETVIQTTFLAKTLGKLIAGDVPLKALGGPMMIAKVAGDSAKAGWKAFISTMALISVNLAVLNLFPIPALDGGQLVLMGVEGIRRRRLSEAAVENFQKIGFVMIVALVILATYNDLSRFWASMLKSVSGLFE